jgi:hypothetical protein|tara:strand:- start:181 stop:864 length:684 start_codon:yes stop_codon:yes gene_type:complete
MFPFSKPKTEEITVLDNFLEESDFKDLHTEVINCNAWGYTGGISVDDEGDPKVYYGFSSGVIDDYDESDDAKENYLFGEGPHINLVKQLNDKVKDYFNFKQVIRSRLDMTTYRGDNEIIFGPHIDCDREHMTSIFYVTDSDAPTIIYNEKRFCGDVPKDMILTEKQRVMPKQNRLVVFPGNHIHTGMCPIKYPMRILVNTNYRGIRKKDYQGPLYAPWTKVLEGRLK